MLAIGTLLAIGSFAMPQRWATTSTVVRSVSPFGVFLVEKDSTELEGDDWTCPDCRYVFFKGESFCWMCGFDMRLTTSALVQYDYVEEDTRRLCAQAKEWAEQEASKRTKKPDSGSFCVNNNTTTTA